MPDRWTFRVTVGGIDLTGPNCDSRQKAEALATIVRSDLPNSQVETERVE